MSKSAVVTYGRFQGITIGHEALVKKMIKFNKDADVILFTSTTVDNKKNILSFNEKVWFLKKIFPNIIIVNDRNVNATIITSLHYLYKEGYNDVTVFVGEDRFTKFKALEKYNIPESDSKFDSEKNFSFDSLKFKLAGKRLLDSGSNVEKASSTELKKLAQLDDFNSFKKMMPLSTSKQVATKLFNILRKRLPMKENKNMIMSFLEFIKG